MKQKNKNISYIIGFLLLILIAYQFSFSKTIKAKHTYLELVESNELFSSIMQNKNLLQQQVSYYDSLLIKYQISSESSFQNNLLNTLADYAQQNQLKIINFQDPHRFLINENAIQETYRFTFESNFNSIIKLIYSLEQDHKFGKIISVEFDKKKNYKSNKEYLHCTLYLQKITQE